MSLARLALDDTIKNTQVAIEIIEELEMHGEASEIDKDVKKTLIENSKAMEVLAHRILWEMTEAPGDV